jgi:hypothetical protein
METDGAFPTPTKPFIGTSNRVTHISRAVICKYMCKQCIQIMPSPSNSLAGANGFVISGRNFEQLPFSFVELGNIFIPFKRRQL